MGEVGARLEGQRFRFRRPDESDVESVASSSRTSRSESSSFADSERPPRLRRSQKPKSLEYRLEEIYKKNRDQLLLPDGVTITPLKVLKDLCVENGYPFEVITVEIHPHGAKPEAGAVNLRHRVTLKAGGGLGEGQGEAPHFRLACQFAAADLLEKAKEAGGHNIPLYGLLAGCRINPKIHQELREFCKLENLDHPRYDRVAPESIGSRYLYTFKCSIGSKQTLGSSDSIFLAKRLASIRMLKDLTGRYYRSVIIAHGSNCLSDAELLEMGIKLAVNVRPRRSGSAIPALRRPPQEDDLHEDDYGEEDDDVSLLRKQLYTIQITIPN